MASTFSPDLRIELIGPGDQAGTWGTTTNTNLGTLIEDAIAGYISVSVTSANQAFTANNGAADQARNATIALTTTTGAAFAVYAPPAAKQYVIYNTAAYAATVYNSTVLGNTTAAGLGVAVPAGAKAGMFSDGTNFRAVEAPDGSITTAKLADGAATGAKLGNDVIVTTGDQTILGNKTFSGNLSYTTTLTGGTGVVNIGSEQIYKDASGNVGIGTSSPAEKLSVAGAVRVHTASSAGFTFDSKGGLFDFVPEFNNVRVGYVPGTSGVNTGILSFVVGSGSEAARIDSSGNLLVGATSQINAGLFCAQGNLSQVNTAVFKNTVAQTGGQTFVFFANSTGGGAGQINHTGITTVAYATSSDYRLKEAVAPITDALAKVNLLKPCTYTWKEDGKAGQGFIAHELQAVVPDCVVGEKDEVDADGNPVYQGIDTSFLVATLTAAIQEQQALITALTTRITALESAP